jgi:hypothetical protein
MDHQYLCRFCHQPVVSVERDSTRTIVRCAGCGRTWVYDEPHLDEDVALLCFQASAFVATITSPEPAPKPKEQ